MNAKDLGCRLEVGQDQTMRQKVGITRMYMQKLCPIYNCGTSDSFEHEFTVPGRGWIKQFTSSLTAGIR